MTITQAQAELMVPVLIVALGMTFVIITGGIDLSVGSVYALSGVLAAYASRWGVLAALLVPLAASALIGFAQGWLIGRFRVVPFVVTLGGLLLARGLLQTMPEQTFSVPRDSGFLLLGHGAMEWICVLVVYLLGGLLLRRTAFGLRLRAIGSSPGACVLMGLPVVRTKVTVYVLSGLLAGLAGVLTAAQWGSAAATAGMGLEVAAILAVVIGGTLLTGGSGAVSGTLAGAAVLWVIHSLTGGSVTSNTHAVVSGALLVVVVAAQTLLSHRRST